MRKAIFVCSLFICIATSMTAQERDLDPRLAKALNTMKGSEYKSSDGAEESKVFFEGDYEALKKKAEEDNKEILLHFGADWCLPCKQMKKMTYPNALVQKKINEGYIAFEVDVDFFWGMDIAEEYGVLKYPTVIITNAEGKVKKKQEGYLGPKEMYKLLRAY